MKVVLLGANGQLGSDISYVFKQQQRCKINKSNHKKVDTSGFYLLSDLQKGLNKSLYFFM